MHVASTVRPEWAHGPEIVIMKSADRRGTRMAERKIAAFWTSPPMDQANMADRTCFV
jgi:hypothetical protein